MVYENIIFEMQDETAIITFNRPRAMNALNRELLEEFSSALEKIEKNDKIGVLILTGMGEKAFVAGADINELATFNPLQGKLFSEMGQNVMDKLQRLPIPVIAAVNGYALGGGSEIALACDFIYASDNAKFGFPEISLGIIPGFGGTQRLARLIGINVAKELIFTGKIISAKEAGALGIVNKVVVREELMERVMETARTITSRGKVSMRAAKYAINTGIDVDLATGCKIEADAFAICMASQDAKEGTRAFLEKRQPVFKGTYLD